LSETQSGSALVRLLLIRHADAGEPGSWIGPDAERPLSDKGVKQAARLAAALLAAKTTIDGILTSPARRCGETATILAAALGIEARAEAHLADGPTLEALRTLLTKRMSSLALVGHEPHLSALIGELTGITNVVMAKGAVIRIDIARPLERGSGSLVWIAPPSLFRAPKGER